MYDTFLEPLHNYLLHLLTSRTPPVLQKNMRCAEYSSGDRRGPTLMGTPRHCTNHAFRAVRQWGGRGPTLISTPRHSKKPCVLCGTAVGWAGPTLMNTSPRFKKTGVSRSTAVALGGVQPLWACQGLQKISRFAQHSDGGAHFGRRSPTLQGLWAPRGAAKTTHFTQYGGGGGRGPTLMDTPRHCKNHPRDRIYKK